MKSLTESFKKPYKIILFTITFFILLRYTTIYASSNLNDKTKKTFNLYITVVDSASDKPLELVNLILQKDGKIVDINITNHSGESIFHDLEPGKYMLATHYVGYKDYTLNVNIDHDNFKINLKLSESAIGLGEVVVTGSKVMHVSNFVDIKTGNQTFQGETFHAPPSARMTTVIQENLTGAVRAPTGEVHIRGQHGEFSYYIDGIPIPLGVFGGLNEVVDPKVIRLITFYTGGFPAEYGGQITGLINIQNQVPPGPFHLTLSTYGGSYLTSANNIGQDVGRFK